MACIAPRASLASICGFGWMIPDNGILKILTSWCSQRCIALFIHDLTLLPLGSHHCALTSSIRNEAMAVKEPFPTQQLAILGMISVYPHSVISSY